MIISGGRERRARPPNDLGNAENVWAPSSRTPFVMSLEAVDKIALSCLVDKSDADLSPKLAARKPRVVGKHGFFVFEIANQRRSIVHRQTYELVWAASRRKLT